MDCLLHCISLSKTQIHNRLNFHARLLCNPEKLIATLNNTYPYPAAFQGPAIAAQLTRQSRPWQDVFKWQKLQYLFQVSGAPGLMDRTCRHAWHHPLLVKAPGGHGVLKGLRSSPALLHLEGEREHLEGCKVPHGGSPRASDSRIHASSAPAYLRGEQPEAKRNSQRALDVSGSDKAWSKGCRNPLGK